ARHEFRVVLLRTPGKPGVPPRLSRWLIGDAAVAAFSGSRMAMRAPAGAPRIAVLRSSSASRPALIAKAILIYEFAQYRAVLFGYCAKFDPNLLSMRVPHLELALDFERSFFEVVGEALEQS